MIVCNSFSITLFHEGVKELSNEPKQKEGKGDESNKSEVEGTPTKENKSVFSLTEIIGCINLGKKVTSNVLFDKVKDNNANEYLDKPHGSILHEYKGMVNDKENGIVEINVEDPARGFVALRDSVDYDCLTFNTLPFNYQDVVVSSN